MDGGIAKSLFLHGMTGEGGPAFPRVHAYLAGWGKATVYKDGEIMYKDFGAHFMLTQGLRDETNHRIDFPPVKDVQTLLSGSVDPATLNSIKNEIRESAENVNPKTMQLHIVAHSSEKDPASVPPFTKFIHFMFDEVIWH